MTIASKYSELSAEKWYTFLDTPPTTQAIVDQGGSIGTMQLRTSTSSTTPTLITNGSGPEGNNCWRFTGVGTNAITLAVTGAISSWQTSVQDNDYVRGIWLRFNKLPDSTAVNAVTVWQLTTYSQGGYILRLAGRTGSASTENKLALQVTSTATLYSTERIYAGVWYFVAIKKSGTQYTLYINGVSQGTVTGNTGSPTNEIYGATSQVETTGAAFDLSYPVQFTTAITDSQLLAISNERTFGKYGTKLSSIDNNLISYQSFNSLRSTTTGFESGNNSASFFSMGGAYGTWETTPGKDGLYAVKWNANGVGGSILYSVTLTSAYSMSFWFKSPARPATDKALFYWQSSPSPTEQMTLASQNGVRASDGYFLWGPKHNNVTPVGPITSGKDVCDNQWHHIVLTKNGDTIRMYVDGAQASTSTTSNYASSGGTGTNFAFDMPNISLDEFAIHNFELTAQNVSDLYNSILTSTNIQYTSTTGATASALMAEATWSTTMGAQVNADPKTASALQNDITLNLDSVLDSFGLFSGSADIVHPAIATQNNITIAADATIASAEMTAATTYTEVFVNYAASPATASALLSDNFFGGQTTQDTTYSLYTRQLSVLNGTNTNAHNGFSIGITKSGTTKTAENALLLVRINGLPAYNKLVKVKFDPTHVTAVATGDIAPSNTFDIYKVTSAIADPTTIAAGSIQKTFLYTTRLIDDGSNTQFYLDLTRAFSDLDGYTNGIYIALHDDGESYTGTDQTQFNGSNLDNHILYVISADIINKNVNADVTTASADFVNPTVDTQVYVNINALSADASADSVTPTIVTEQANNYNASPATASVLVVHPGFVADTSYTSDHLEAFIEFPTPQLSVTGSAFIYVTPATLEAMLHMPQANIGENNIVDHMNASALMVEPTLFIPDTNTADAMIANATMADASPVTGLNTINTAEPMRASAQAPNPPAYIDLFADRWYSTLYAQHSVRHGLPSGYGGAFLKIFEDQNTDISQATPNTVQGQNVFNGEPTLRQLRNNITYGMSVNSGPENDIRYVVAPAVTDYSTAANESRLSVGYFDPYGRKAVRMQNIAFKTKSDLGYAQADFSMEFSIKTTKANQILSYGEWASATGPGNGRTTFNLVNGKLNYFTYSGSTLLHPNSTKPTSGYVSLGEVTGNKAINDGQWHHVVIQYVQGPEMDGGIVGRFQIWIDGALDIQRFNQGVVYDPDYIGANISDVNFAPDFYTSAWSIDAPGTVSERDISLHNYDYIKYEPVRAEPMTASLTMTSGNKGFGNRGRALMLYWWPTSSGQNQNQITRKFDTFNALQGEFDVNMFVQELETIDYVNQPPQSYYGWDVFPVDINGYFVSDLVKEEAYGGAQNIQLQDLGGAVLGGYESPRPQFKVNRRGYFRNTLDDTRRYIDLVNDIDLSQFDAIFFKNYPDQSNEIDTFSRNEIVDPYFNIRETKIYQDFIKSLRAAIDTGISLMVNNPQLALDLKIIDRIDVVPDLQDISGYQSDPYTPTIVPSAAASLDVGTGDTNNVWWDTYKNNKIRVLNTISGLTDGNCLIPVGFAFYNNDDTLDYGAPSRPFKSWAHRPNGLSIGDEFFLSSAERDLNTRKNYLAVPIQNVKAGTPITAFANQYRQGLNLVDNPYKNHVTSIAIRPGDVLDGRQVNSKIWVNFTEPISRDNTYVTMDAIHTYWINLAFSEGQILEAAKNIFLASPELLENRLASGDITQEEYDKLSFWQFNGMNILTQTTKLEEGEGKESDFGGDSGRKVSIRKNRKVSNFRPNKTSILGGVQGASMNITVQGQFFSFSYGNKYEQLKFIAESMQDKGFLWLSIRETATSQSQSHTAVTASATMVQPIIVGQKSVSINSQSMLANATKVSAVGFGGPSVNTITLPLTASALMTAIPKLVSAVPMTATAAFRDQVVTRTSALDQVIVYILHEDPILYLREDIIK